METTGDLCEIQGETTLEWKIKDLFPLCDEKNKVLNSSLFYFSGASWKIQLYPNGDTEDGLEGWISLYVIKASSGSPVTIDCSFNLKSFEGDTYQTGSLENEFYIKSIGWGFSKFVSRSKLLGKKSQLKASSDVIIICTMKSKESNSVTGTLFNRQMKIIDNLKELRAKAKKTDCTLKVDGQNVPAHRMILETRSSVFAAMFTHDTRENRTGEILIDDMDTNSIDFIIEYMYSGDIPPFETKSVLSVYAAADKYDIQDVKEISLEFIRRNLSVDWVCDVIKFAELYSEEEISLLARNYFKDHARKILNTEKWKEFSKGNYDLSLELLGSIVVALLPE